MKTTKPIKDYEWLYSIVTDGNIVSFVSHVITKGTRRKNWYMSFSLRKDWTKKHCYVHGLVAQAFIPNPENKPYVNHIDWNPSNNSVENLEWCTPAENMHHAREIICTVPKKKKVMQLTKEGILCGIYDSCYDAEKSTWLKHNNIHTTAQWKFKHCWGFVWKFI